MAVHQKVYVYIKINMLFIYHIRRLNKAGIIYLFSYDRFGTTELMTLFIVTLGHDLDFFRKSLHE